ncbi:MAG: hypothetical protein R2827_05410 [Bdellovibrionales bacterium]
MRKLLSLLTMGLMAFSLSESALAQSCPQDWPDEICQGLNQNNVAPIFYRWYLEPGYDPDQSFIASSIFFAEERFDTAPILMNDPIYSVGDLTYRQSEFDQWVSDVQGMIATAETTSEYLDLYQVLEYALFEVDTFEHFAYVLDFLITINHPGAGQIPYDVETVYFYLIGGFPPPESMDPTQKMIAYREFVCSLQNVNGVADACPPEITSTAQYFSSNSDGVTYSDVAVFFEGNRSQSDPLYPNQEPFDIVFDTGVAYSEREFDSLLAAAEAMIVNGMSSSVKSQVDLALFNAGLEVDTVAQFAKILHMALEYEMVEMPSEILEWQKQVGKQRLADGEIDGWIYEWVKDVAEVNNVDIYDAQTDTLRDLP